MTTAAVVTGAVAFVGVGQGAALGQSIVRSAWHAPNLVTSDDIALFHLMSARLGPSAKVLNSPRDGSGWMYALSNVTPVQPYVYGRPPSLVQMLAGTGAYADAATTCQALAATGATHALAKSVLGDVSYGKYDVPGFIDRHPQLFSEIARSGTAVLYRIDRSALDRCADA